MPLRTDTAQLHRHNNNDMFTHSRKFILGSGIALALVAVSGLVAAATVSHKVVATGQETPIWVSYVLIPHLHANDPRVPMRSSESTLTGVVAEDGKEMDNLAMAQIAYVPPGQPSVRTYGEVMEDARITTAVTSRLMWSKHTNNLTTDIYTKWGKVTLRGIAGNAAARNHASRLAMDTRGVRLVNNQLLVMGTTAADVETTTSPAHAPGQVIADRWITTKVKSTFMYSNSVDDASIAVNTRGGVVILTGKLGSGTERALAIELANSVRGVMSVQSEGLTPLNKSLD